MSEVDISWAAGFFEGEGSFQQSTVISKAGKSYSYSRISAAQVQLEPLERLVSMFGGKVYGPYNNVNQWVLHGKKAAELMIWLYPHMSLRRKKQIEVALS